MRKRKEPETPTADKIKLCKKAKIDDCKDKNSNTFQVRASKIVADFQSLISEASSVEDLNKLENQTESLLAKIKESQKSIMVKAAIAKCVAKLSMQDWFQKLDKPARDQVDAFVSGFKFDSVKMKCGQCNRNDDVEVKIDVPIHDLRIHVSYKECHGESSESGGDVFISDKSRRIFDAWNSTSERESCSLEAAMSTLKLDRLPLVAALNVILTIVQALHKTTLDWGNMYEELETYSHAADIGNPYLEKKFNLLGPGAIDVPTCRFAQWDEKAKTWQNNRHSGSQLLRLLPPLDEFQIEKD